MAEDIIKIKVLLQDNLKKAQANLDTYAKKVQVMTKVNARQVNAYENRLDAVTAAQQRLNKITQKARPMFQGWMLSVLFLAQAMSRVFQQIRQQSIKTFQEVAHSVNGEVTNKNNHNGEMDNLKYTVGSTINETLTPLIPLIVDIITRIANWETQNPRLVATIIDVGSALAFLLNIGAQIGLLLNGLSMAGISFSGVISGLGTIFTTTFLMITGLIALAIIAWKTNFGGFRDFLKNMFGGVFETISRIFKGIVAIVKDVMTIVTGIFEGDFDKVFRGILSLFKNVIKLVLQIANFVGFAVENVVIFLLNSVNDLIFKVLGGLITGIVSFMGNLVKSAITKLASLLGLQNSSIVQGMLSSVDKSLDITDKVKEGLVNIGDKLKLEARSSEDLKSSNENISKTADNIYNIVINATGLNEQELATEITRATGA